MNTFSKEDSDILHGEVLSPNPEVGVEIATPIGKGVHYFRAVKGKTVWELVEEYNVPVNVQPILVVVGEEPLLREYWGEPLTENTRVSFVALPRGGSIMDILRVVAMLALSIIAPIAAPALAGILGITSSLGISLIGAGIVLAGGFLINLLLPASTPKLNDDRIASGTYSITAQGNNARLYQVMPVPYGNHIIYPDFASVPWAEYEGNNQYLYMLFSHGMGELIIEEGRIEDTAFWNSTDGYTDSFTGITLEIVPPGEPVTLFPSQVITSVEVSGVELRNYATTGSVEFAAAPANTMTANTGNLVQVDVGDKIVIDIGLNAGTWIVLAKDSVNSTITVNGPLVNESNDVTVSLHEDTQWIGPFVANTSTTATDKLQFDITFPSGLVHFEKEGDLDDFSVGVEYQAREIDSAGIPIGGGEGTWVTLDTVTYTNRTITPQRITETFLVDRARYDARARRADPQTQENDKADTVQWTGLKAFIPHDNTYDNVTLTAVKMLATGQLSSQSSRKVNFIQSRKLPIWNGTTWSAPTVTRSIAWAACDILRNTVYGGALTDNRIDLAKMLELDAIWSARGDYFDGVFDTKTSCWNALQQVLLVGRSQPIIIAGVVSAFRDQLQTLPKGVFTPRNILRGSFETRHILFDNESPDDVIIEFIDRRTWKQNEVQCTLPDSDSEQPERRQLFGCTERLQAWREGIFMAAVNARRRVIAKFGTELEGRLLARGDMILVAHDLYEWGEFGDVVDYVDATRHVTTSQPVTTTSPFYIYFKGGQGEGWGPILATIGVDANTVVLNAVDLAAVEGDFAQDITDFISTGDDGGVPTMYVVAHTTTEFKNFLLIGAAPGSGEFIDLVMQNDDISVHTVDEDLDPPDEVFPYGPGSIPTGPVVASLTASLDVTSTPTQPVLNISWSAAGGATDYVLQLSYDDLSWETIYQGGETMFSQIVAPGVVYLRIAAIGSVRGPWKEFSGTYGSVNVLPNEVTGILLDPNLTGGMLGIDWDNAARAVTYTVKVYIETVLDSGTFNILKLTKRTPLTSIQIPGNQLTTLGGPWKNFKVEVNGVNSAGAGAAGTATYTGLALPTVSNLVLVTPYNKADLALKWDLQGLADSYQVKLFNGAVLKATYVVNSPNITVTKAQLIEANGSAWTPINVEVRAKNAAIISATAATLTVTATGTGTNDATKVNVAGDTMTGALIHSAGNDSLPGAAVGEAGTGFSLDSTGIMDWSLAGVWVARLGTSGFLALGDTAYTATNSIHILRFGTNAARIMIHSEGSSGITTNRSSADANAPTWTFGKGRGTYASPAFPNSLDILGDIFFSILNTALAQITAVSIRGYAIGTPSATDAEGRLLVRMCPAGSVTLTEAFRFDLATGLSMFGANPVIDQNRDHRLRSITIATLPTHTAGKIVYCSDLGGGGGKLTSNGTNWKRDHPGQAAPITSDASHAFTWAYLTNASIIRGNATLTANRTVTLGTTGVPPGTVLRFTRVGAGAFNWDIGGLKNLLQNTWCDVAMSSAGAWELSAAGAL
jgi:hypothetical protein